MIKINEKNKYPNPFPVSDSINPSNVKNRITKSKSTLKGNTHSVHDSKSMLHEEPNQLQNTLTLTKHPGRLDERPHVCICHGTL